MSHKVDRHFWCCNCGRKGHLIEECRHYLYSEYPRTPLRVIRYTELENNFDEFEGGETERKRAKVYKEKKPRRERKSSTCPNSPERELPVASGGSYSEPGTPAGWVHSLTTADLQEAVENLSGRQKFNAQRQLKKKKAKLQRKIDEKSKELRQICDEEGGKGRKKRKRQEAQEYIPIRFGEKKVNLPPFFNKSKVKPAQRIYANRKHPKPAEVTDWKSPNSSSNNNGPSRKKLKQLKYSERRNNSSFKNTNETSFNHSYPLKEGNHTPREGAHRKSSKKKQNRSNSKMKNPEVWKKPNGKKRKEINLGALKNFHY